MQMAQGRRKITRDFYEKLLGAFREAPGNASHAADYAHCDRRTAKKAWETGFPSTGDWARPIHEVLKEEQIAARAKLAETAAATTNHEGARSDAIDARAEEAMLVRAARVSAGRYQESMQHMLMGVTELSKRIRVEMEKLALPDGVDGNGDPTYPKVNLVSLTRLIQTVSSAIRQGNEAGLIAMRMERLHLGMPGEIIGYQDMGMDEAADHIRRSHRALDRASRRGLVLLPGGKAAGTTGAGGTGAAGGGAGSDGAGPNGASGATPATG